MPTSSHEGKDWLVPRIEAEIVNGGKEILDIGPGQATYPKLVPNARHAEWYAIEIFEPYVVQYGLEGYYRSVRVADARTQRFPKVDVVIMGDVLEHMSKEDAEKVWNKARHAARKAVFVSMPLGEFPQGAVNGNEAERHISTWSNEEVHALGGVVASWVGVEIGVYAVAPS